MRPVVPCRGPDLWSRLKHHFGERVLTRLRVTAVEEMMAGRPADTLEAVLEVFEVFASRSLNDEVYILEIGRASCRERVYVLV